MPFRSPSSRLPWAVTLAYAGLAACWIGLSDQTLSFMITDPALLGQAQTVKGWGFVAVTAVFLYLAMRSTLRWQRVVFDEIRTVRDRLTLALAAADGTVWELRPRAGASLAESRLDDLQVATCSSGGAWSDVADHFAAVDTKDRQPLLDAFDAAVRSPEPQPFAATIRVALPAGPQRVFRLLGRSMVTDKGERLVGVATDITAHARTETWLREALAQGRLATWRFDLLNDRIEFDETWASLLGFTQSELEPFSLERWATLTEPEDANRFLTEVLSSVTPQAPQHEGEYRMRHRDGQWITVLSRCHVTDWTPDGRPAVLTGVNVDVTELRELQARAEASAAAAQHNALHDALTGLPNRAFFLTELERTVAAARAAETGFAILFVDLDNFKQINDSLGHHAGDDLLQAVAMRLGSLLGEGEMLARLAGDEFVLILRTADRQDARARAATVHEAFLRPFPAAARSIYAMASLGLALFPEDAADAGGLLQCADLAMYGAKADGRNAVRLFDGTLKAAAERRSQIAQALQRSLDGGGFSLALQPKFSLRDGQALAGVEALLRWRDDELGEVPPAEFIPIAESSGLISSFDGVTAKLVSDLTQAWEARGIDLPIAFNLSAATLSSVKGAFLGEVFLRLGLRPGRTTIEITESAIMGHVSTAQADIEGLVKAGFRVAIDDFGTGYSSLAYLQALPIQEVKIDRSFVARLGGPEERGSIAIIRAVLAIAEALGLETVAEGVETEAQLAWLKTQGCHRAQGFLFSRPLPVAEFEERYLCTAARRAG